MVTPSAEIKTGHVLDVLAGMPARSVHCAITSPPYWGLRNYDLPPSDWGDGWRGCLGLEPEVGMFTDHLVEVFEAVGRVMRDDATLWVNIGDTYAGSWGNCGARRGHQREKTAEVWRRAGYDNFPDRPPSSRGQSGIPNRSLCLVPARLAIAMQEAGWIVRSAIIWAKGVSFCDTYHGAVMPGSMKGWRFEDGKLKKGSWRPTSAHELVYFFAKRPKYYADSEASREPNGGCKEYHPQRRLSNRHQERRPKEASRYTYKQGDEPDWPSVGRNIRDVWTIATAKFPGAHFATFPPKLVAPMIRAATSEWGTCPECGAPWAREVERSHLNPGNRTTNGPRSLANRHQTAGFGRRLVSSFRTLGWRPTCDCADTIDVPADHDPEPATVLDPFAGAGTTLMVARELGRHSIGIELSEHYAGMARERLEESCPRPPKV